MKGRKRKFFKWKQEPLVLPFIREPRWECFNNEAILEMGLPGAISLFTCNQSIIPKAIHCCSNFNDTNLNYAD